MSKFTWLHRRKLQAASQEAKRSVQACFHRALYSSSPIGATESGLVGQHLASTVLADIRLVCVLSALFFYLLCLSVSFPMWEPHSFVLCLVIWNSFNPTTLGSDPAVQCQAPHLCATTFLIAFTTCESQSQYKADSLKHKSSPNVPSSVTFEPDENQEWVA